MLLIDLGVGFELGFVAQARCECDYCKSKDSRSGAVEFPCPLGKPHAQRG